MIQVVNAYLPIAAAAGPPVAGYTAWYDASDLASITESGGAVSQWDDKSGNGNHVVQGTAGAKPTTGIRTQNGLNVLDFDGGDGLSVTFANRTASRTIFAVVKMDDSSVGRAHVVLGPGAPSCYFDLATNSFATWNNGPALAAISADTSAHVLTHSCVSGGDNTVHKDGVAGSGGAGTGSQFSATILSVGINTDLTSFFWDGWIGEVIIYESVLGTTDRQAVESYLKTKWGTP